MIETQEARIENIIKESSNKIYAGMHWIRRKKLKDSYLWLTKGPFSRLKPVKEKVNLQFDFFWGVRPLDSSNCSFMAKMIEDCLVAHGILENDTINHVGKIIIESHKSRLKEMDYCIVKIF